MTLDPKQRWVASTALGCLSYLVILSSGKTIPLPLRTIAWAFPIGLLGYSIKCLTPMEEQIEQEQGMRALIQQQEEHALIRQHQLNLVTREMDYLATLNELRDQSAIAVDSPSPQDGSWGFDLGNPFGLLEASIPLDRKVLESLGEPALAVWGYVSQRNHNLCDKDGWVAISKIRANWGRNRNLDTESVRQLLSGLNSFGIGCWKDARQQEWKLLLSL